MGKTTTVKKTNLIGVIVNILAQNVYHKIGIIRHNMDIVRSYRSKIAPIIGCFSNTNKLN